MPKLPTILSHQSGFPQDGDMLRLHCNENPYGPPPGALDAVAKEVEAWCAAYPDTDATAPRERIAARHGLSPEMVSMGNGVDELVLLISLSFLGDGGSVLVTDTTFPGYAASAAVARAEIRSVPLNEHRVPVGAFVDALADRPRLAFVCNPHNPAGTVLEPGDVERILGAAERHGVIPVFDEAYMDFAAPRYEYAMQAVRDGRRLLVLRTFSKAWGLAGLRAGYVAGPADLVGQVRHTRLTLPFNLNRPAQQAVVAALGSEDFITDVRRRTAAARDRLYDGLRAAGLEFVRSETNFVLVRTPGDSTEFARRLAVEHRILVRDLTSFGMPGYLRVTVGTPSDVDRFVAAVAPGAPAARQRSGGSALGAAEGAIAVPTLPAFAPEALFNGYVGAHVVHGLNQLAVWDRLREKPWPLHALAGTAEVGKVLAMLRAAALLGYVTLTEEPAENRPVTIVALTESGRDVVRLKGFFTWSVGGYHEILRGMAGLATGDLAFERDVDRDGRMVAVGSGEVGHALMRSVEAEVLADLDFASVADLGCGDASRLIRLCGADARRHGVGIEINERACGSARERVAKADLAGRIEVVAGDVLHVLGERSFPGIELVTCFLMLHDLFDSSGDPPGVLRRLRAGFPDARYFLLGDTTAQEWASQEMPLPVFSMGFELVHAFMETPIVARPVYEDAFAEAGLSVRRLEPLGAPSTWLWLLSTD